MEGLILFIIMGIIGSLMSKNKEKQTNEKSMPPFNNKPNTYEHVPQQNAEQKKPQTRSLEDFAKDIFEQLNEKTQPREVYSEPKPKEVVVEPTVTTERVQLNSNVSVPKRNSGNNRPTLDENRSSKKSDRASVNDVIKQNEIGSYVPNSKHALVQAIVASEIIGPPKAKRRQTI